MDTKDNKNAQAQDQNKGQSHGGSQASHGNQGHQGSQGSQANPSQNHGGNKK